MKWTMKSIVFETKRIILSVWKKNEDWGAWKSTAKKKKKFYKIASEIYMEDLKKSVISHEASKGNK